MSLGSVSSFDSLEFRNALGTFATGVCVVTANPEGYEPFGMTVNSFASVSLDPALVLWSLQNNSECFSVFEKADKFAVNILASDQIDLSNLYAQKNNHVLAPKHFRIGKSGLPVVRGVVTSFECNVWARYPGGDHVILVGEVTEMENNSNKEPLLFNAGQYRELR
ncbi:MAG: flavin reductase family protein [Oceanicoccus sp.]|uniref:flavin reductase family protein n=1 Tax=Oceanicoccus sp. TaxID=2691044 RepID=UPI002637388D|nr:flavin reductase family protein [Oceanicoccus sp.]MCP3906991.1 flavin reductase family protein [Oceanicoccus sp.]MDG1772025.1 flavin reductase family protein [Oceanicoccus sp.]